ncbi:MAG: hypothetical protein ACYS0C_02330 [Planctomycetota bacterium]|jgi:hypothetical protein
MKRLIGWLVVAAIGFILMLFSYFNYQYDTSPNPWKDSFMYIGKADPNSQAEGLDYVQRPIRLLPISPQAQNFTNLAHSFGSYVEKSYRVQFQEKIILYAEPASDFTNQMLEWGRFPSLGTDEVLAGFNTSSKDKITVDGREFKVVGQFKKEVRLFVDSYLFSNSAAAGELFNPDHEAVQNAYILHLSKTQLYDSDMHQQLAEAFPKPQFVPYVPFIQAEPGPFYIYILGLAFLFLGGSVVLFNTYGLLAEKLSNKWIRLPLAEIGRYKHLFLAMHLIYFGTVLLLMLVAYHLPELQVSLLAGIKSQVTGSSGPLAVAGRAYMSKSILRAALATFVINFSLGSLAVITVPSVIVPGAGVLIAGVRAALWGLLLAPSFVALSSAMLLHSFTLLLEGEGYILASFFGLLILIYLFRKAEGTSVAGRYGRALLMNVRGNLLVALVLAIAAIYEAIEVILSMP